MLTKLKAKAENKVDKKAENKRRIKVDISG